MKFLFVILLAAFVCSCKDDQAPPGVIDQEKFEAVYIELLDSSAIGRKDSANFQISPTAERILARHQVSVDQLKATVAHFNRDTKKWKSFYENVVKKMSQSHTKEPPK